MQGFIFTFSINDSECKRRGLVTVFSKNYEDALKLVNGDNLKDFESFIHDPNLKVILETTSFSSYEITKSGVIPNMNGIVLTSFLL